jgi:hypothetical protein
MRSCAHRHQDARLHQSASRQRPKSGGGSCRYWPVSTVHPTGHWPRTRQRSDPATHKSAQPPIRRAHRPRQPPSSPYSLWTSHAASIFHDPWPHCARKPQLCLGSRGPHSSRDQHRGESDPRHPAPAFQPNRGQPYAPVSSRSGQHDPRLPRGGLSQCQPHHRHEITADL